MSIKKLLPILSIALLTTGCANCTGLVNRDLGLLQGASYNEIDDSSVKPEAGPENDSVSEIVPLSLTELNNISSIKNELLGENTECEFDDYKSAYAHIARLYNMSSKKCVYGLIDVDGDAVPELVIDNPGIYVSLYSFKNRKLQCLLYQSGYGTGGKYGYKYAPGKGVLSDRYYDQARAVQYDDYLTIGKDGKLLMEFYVESLYFNDLDGDRKPSEYELSATERTGVFETHYYDHNGKEISDDAIRLKFANYFNYRYETLTGNMSYDELINKVANKDFRLSE